MTRNLKKEKGNEIFIEGFERVQKFLKISREIEQRLCMHVGGGRVGREGERGKA